jgi:hypothetical protein
MGNCSSTSNCNPCGPDFSAINQLATKAGAYARQANRYAIDAQNTFLEFNDLYLGAFAVAPTVDNEGDPLQVGALYWNSVINNLWVWDGTNWMPAVEGELYLGGFATAPTLDNEGNPLQLGNLYWNTASNNLWAYDGTAWVETEFNEFTPFLATGTPTARNLVTRTADVVNVKDFGAVGDGVTDDTAAIQAAADKVRDNGGGVLYIPAGEYKQNGGVALSSNTEIFAYGAEMDCSDLAYSTTISTFNPAYSTNGTIAATTTLASNVSKNAISINVASSAGMVEGQIIRIISTVTLFTTPGSIFRRYDINRIKRISGNTIFLESPCIDAFRISEGTVNITSYDPIENVKIYGMKLIGGGFKENLANGLGQCGMVFNSSRNVIVQDCTISGFQGIAVNSGISIDVQCKNVEFIGADEDLVIVEDLSSGFYAFYPSFSRRVKIIDCFGIRPRHIADAINCIDVIQENNTTIDSWRAAYGTHPNCWNVFIHGNSSFGCHSGVVSRGINTIIDSNNFQNTRERGIDTNIFNREECSIIVSNNIIDVVGGLSGQLGIGIDLRPNYTSISLTNNSITSNNNSIQILANKVKDTTISFNSIISSNLDRAIVIGSDSNPSILNEINGLLIESNCVSAPNKTLPIYINGSRTPSAKAKNIRVLNNTHIDMASIGGNTIAGNSSVGDFSGPVRYENNRTIGEGTDLIGSTDFSLWTKTRTTAIASTQISPIGALDATLLFDTATTSGTHFIRRTVPVTSGTVYTYEIIAKQGTLKLIDLDIDDAFAPANARIDLNAKTIISSSGADNVNIFNLNNDWVYCSLTATATATTDGIFSLFLVEDTLGTNFVGNGLRNVNIWGGRIKSVS